MKKALISPNEGPIKYISEWTSGENPKPIYSTYENSCRIAEVSVIEFLVSAPLFWIECVDDVDADLYYFNLSSNQIFAIQNAPYPN